MAWTQLPCPSQNHVRVVSICSSTEHTYCNCCSALVLETRTETFLYPIDFACEVTGLQGMRGMPSFIQQESPVVTSLGKRGMVCVFRQLSKHEGTLSAGSPVQVKERRRNCRSYRATAVRSCGCQMQKVQEA